MSPAKSSAAARDADPVGGAQSIFRVLRILKYVGAAPARGVGLTDVARDLGLTPPTAHRMLSALLQEGFLALNPKLKTYSLGRESYILGLAAESRHGIKAIAESAVLRLAESTGDTSFLSVRSGHEAVCVDRKTGDFPIKILTLEVGHRRPLGVGAGSLALLAFLPNDDIERVLARYDASAAPDLPSTGRHTPVMYFASSLARNSAACATSQASPMRPIGLAALRRRRISSTSSNWPAIWV